MSSTKGPAKRTRTLNGRHYLVRAEGKKRIWVPLTKVTEGLPAFYAALAEQLKARFRKPGGVGSIRYRRQAHCHRQHARRESPRASSPRGDRPLLGP